MNNKILNGVITHNLKVAVYNHILDSLIRGNVFTFEFLQHNDGIEANDFWITLYHNTFGMMDFYVESGINEDKNHFVSIKCSLKNLDEYFSRKKINRMFNKYCSRGIVSSIGDEYNINEHQSAIDICESFFIKLRSCIKEEYLKGLI